MRASRRAKGRPSAQARRWGDLTLGSRQQPAAAQSLCGKPKPEERKTPEGGGCEARARSLAAVLEQDARHRRHHAWQVEASSLAWALHRDPSQRQTPATAASTLPHRSELFLTSATRKSSSTASTACWLRCAPTASAALLTASNVANTNPSAGLFPCQRWQLRCSCDARPRDHVPRYKKARQCGLLLGAST